MGSQLARRAVGTAISTGADEANYGLSPYEEHQLKIYFAQFAGRGQLLSLDEFIRMYSVMNPYSKPSDVARVAARTFAAADVDRNGRITYDDYVRAYILSKSEDLYANLTRVNADGGTMEQSNVMGQPGLMQSGLIQPMTQPGLFGGRPTFVAQPATLPSIMAQPSMLDGPLLSTIQTEPIYFKAFLRLKNPPQYQPLFY